MMVPDLGEFSDVEVIEVLVSPGDTFEIEDGLVTVETDKASMDIPATVVGTVVSVEVAVGDKLNSGDVVAIIKPAMDGNADVAAEADDMRSTRVMSPEEIKMATQGIAAAEKFAEKLTEKLTDTSAAKPSEAAVQKSDSTHSAQLVVIGAGPGGYTAAFRAADLGMNVILVERSPMLGGVCLNVGCIPSKALLHAARVIDEAEEMAEHGVVFGKPKIDATKLLGWKNQVVNKLVGGLSVLAKQRKVKVVHGTAKFASANSLVLDNGETIGFEKCIIAAGSEPFMLPGLPDDPRIVDSTGALEIDPLPKRLLVVGGGIIGLEMACVYAALGVDVSIVELMDSLMPGTDKDLLRPFMKIVKKRYKSIMTSTKVTGMRSTTPGIEVSFEGKNAPSIGVYDRVLVAIGRRANGDQLDAANAGVNVDQ